MDIPFSSRSKFFAPISEALDAAGGCPRVGGVLIELSPEGYGGVVRVDVSGDRTDTFGSDWEGSDYTRFPARIRAAATVLRTRRCFGRFLIVHDQGQLTISALGVR